ncbi:MAG: SURF1 family protein [Steroidobacteraceae bacterium]
MRPRPAWLLLTVLAMALFTTLGFWQWNRGQHKLALAAQFETGGKEAALPLGSRDIATLPRFTYVRLRGEYDTKHQFLLDNMSDSGRPGYQVLTPLHLEDGRVLLVNRGWLQFTGYRDRLPDIAFSATGSTEIRGRLDQLPAAGLASGRAAPALQGSWPRLTTFPQLAELAAALGLPALQPRILLLDADAPSGYTRRWQPPGLSPDRHIAYAVQWWAFAALALILLVVLNRGKRT